MKRFSMLFFATVLAVALGSTAALATPIDLAVGDAYYLGRINDGVPSGDSQTEGYVNYLRTLTAGQGSTPYLGETYDRLNSTVGGPFPVAVYIDRDNTGNNTINAAGYGYILAKYGNNPSLVWFVNGSVTEITVPTSYLLPGTTGGGLSHVAWLSRVTVPDGGATLMLLGGALLGLGALRRKLGA